MNFKDFVEYMDSNFAGKNIFYQKAMEDQLARNARRPQKKRWNENKIDRAIDKIWVELMRNVYDKFKTVINSKSADPYQSWINYIEKNEALESLDEMIVDLEFE
ncbi:hypothetical protein [Carnobacterium inhibens]|uniref:hypothetical protein n=1 Tax=Carnobacterium inhibens TaxID=147709 RepID=UPI000554D9B2|nr:hypothetical protein [Carnobacterium inhibens]